MSWKTYDIKCDKLKRKIESASPKVQKIAETLNSLNKSELQELSEVIYIHLEAKNEFKKLAPGFCDEPDLIGDIQTHQVVNFWLSVLESTQGIPDLDWAPTKECWRCGAECDAYNSRYCSIECSDSFRNWCKALRVKANKVSLKDPDKRREIFMEGIANRLKDKPFPIYTSQLNLK